MASIFDESVFAPVDTFMGAPQSWDLANAKAAVLGIPLDAGTHAVRIGARLGPSAIREQSALVRRYEPPLHNFDPIHNLGLVDCGNARVIPGIIGESLRYSSNRLISALPLLEHRPAWSRPRPSILRGSRLFLVFLDMVHEGSGSSGTQGRWPPLGLLQHLLSMIIALEDVPSLRILPCSMARCPNS